jgi:peptidylprolyl isomerase
MQSRILPALVLLIGVLAFTAGCTQAENGAPSMTTPTTAVQAKLVKLETTMGNITIELRTDMPITAGNFEKLAKQGYYNGVIFHRVIDGFMLQGGDPTGTGRGGPGYTIKDEFTANNRNVRGTISMANAGPNTGGSQFFINLVDNTFLDTKHPVFGKVVQGMDVVDKIGKVRTDQNDRPVTEVKILKATVIQQ